jgi:hypothetical protein
MYRKNGLQQEVETKIKGGSEANIIFINTMISNAIYSVLTENYLKMPLILVMKRNQRGRGDGTISK